MVDVATAKYHGVCPTCEGYGGASDQTECEGEDSKCLGSCPKCWCPGCHNGAELTSPDAMGSWEAYLAAQAIDELPCPVCNDDGYVEIPDHETGGVTGPAPCPNPYCKYSIHPGQIVIGDDNG